MKLNFLGLLLFPLLSLAQENSKIIESTIHSVLVSKENQFEFNSNLMVIPLEEYSNYILSFDDLNLVYKNYYLRIEHFDSNWEKSNLNEIIFLKGFNNQPIREYIQSSSTKVPYIHYQVKLPEVKIGGNYLVQVSTDRYGNKPIFKQRVYVLERKVNLFGKIDFSNFPNLRNTHQKIEIGLRFPTDFFLQNLEDLIFKLFKNGKEVPIHHWPKPILNNLDKTINFQFFNGENTIPAGNEFRLIDLRSAQQKLINVWEIDQSEAITRITTMPNFKESGGSYIQKLDRNENYLFNNLEIPNSVEFIDYVKCKIILKASKQESENLYVVGGFNDFLRDQNSIMIYDSSERIYFKEILLKQGIYNYQIVGDKSEDLIEGNFSQTENQYEIMVYFREPGTNFENLIGFQEINFPN